MRPTTVLLVIKYLGLILTAGYGVYATVTEFHTDASGKRVLTTKGRLGLALLLTAVLVSIVSDALKDRIELAAQTAAAAEAEVRRRAEAQERDQRQKVDADQSARLAQQLTASRAIAAALRDVSASANQTLELTTEVLETSRHLRHPIQQLTAAYAVTLPPSPLFEAKYVSRIEASQPKESWDLTDHRDAWPRVDEDEIGAVFLLGDMTIRLDFYREKPQMEKLVPPADLTVYFRSSLVSSTRPQRSPHRVIYQRGGKTFSIRADSVLWDPVAPSTSRISSVIELRDSYVVLRIPQETSLFMEQMSEVHRVRRGTIWRVVAITTASGETFHIHRGHAQRFEYANGEIAYLAAMDGERRDRTIDAGLTGR